MEDIIFETVDSAHEPTGFKRGDVVKMYKEDVKLTFPCIMLSCEKLEMFRVEAMKGILGTKSLLSEESVYAVYINMNGQVVQIGVMPNTRLRNLLTSKVFDVFEKKIHLDEETTVEGDMLYALCLTAPTY